MTANKKISSALGIIVILTAGAVATAQNIQLRRDSYVAPITSASTSIATNVTSTAVTTAPNTYTLAEVALHNSGTSCWTAINGNVYDVTSWINEHPGGPEAILSLCGTDGSTAFNDQHGGQSRPEAELATFKIGALAQ